MSYLMKSKLFDCLAGSSCLVGVPKFVGIIAGNVYTTLQTVMEEVSNTMETLQGTVGTLQENVNTVTTDVTSLKSDVSQIKTTLSKHIIYTSF